jgi:hypothetical protein
MVSTHSDATVLEPILGVLLEEPPISLSDTTIPPFRACFKEAGVTCGSDFISIDSSNYGTISFSAVKNGTDKDTTLNNIQVKKLNSLISWFRKNPSSPAGHWFDLIKDTFRTWRTESIVTPATSATTPATVPSNISAINDFRKGVKRSISDYKPFKEDHYFNSWQRHLQTTARSHNIDNVINLAYTPVTQEEKDLLDEQKKFAYSVLKQTVLTPDGILIIRVHSDMGDASAVYSDLVNQYRKSTSAQLAASELESELASFCIDASWTKTNPTFLIAWTTKTLDLDNVLEQPITESQKRIWFTQAVAPKAVLSLAISQFNTSEMLTAIGIGSSYTKAQFSVLYDHVKDVAIRADQSERLLQGSSRKVHETQMAHAPFTSDTGVAKSSTSDSKTFVGCDGQRHSFAIPPDQYWAMNPKERLAALAKIRAAKGLPPKIVHPLRERHPGGAGHSSMVTTPASPQTSTMISYAEVVDTNPTPSVVSAITQPPAQPPASSANTLRQVLSSNRVPVTPTADDNTHANTQDDLVSFDGRFYRRISATSILHKLSNHASTPVLSSLIDGGAKGGMAGNDVRILSESSFNKANVTGIGESIIQNLPLASAAGIADTHCGPAIVILHQYANYGKGHTIHSSSQLRAFGTQVHDAPRSNQGLQCLITPDGYHIPLTYRSGLPYMDMRPPNDEEMETLPHILLTGDDIWNPSYTDDEFSIQDLLLDAPTDTGNQDPHVNDTGDYTGNIEADIDLIISRCRAERHTTEDPEDTPNLLERRINQHTISKATPNLEALRPNFGWLPIARIKETLQATTQFARTAPCYPFRTHFCTRWPAANVDRWNEDVATDTFFSDTPAHDDGIFGHSGCTMAQIYAGKRSSKLVAYGMSSESQMPNTLEDLIRKHGAPNCLFSDNAKVQIGKRVRDILCLYSIKDFQCKPEYQHHNFAERKIGDVKHTCSGIMDRMGTPAPSGYCAFSM